MEGPLIVVLTRFSIYDYPPKISAHNLKNIKTEEDYFHWLYGKERMQSKFDYFEKLTVPSLLHQTYKNFKWIIFTSEMMPEIYIEKLRHLTEKIRDVEIRFVKSLKECTQDLKISEPYISVRLDDDDGIHPRLFELYKRFKGQKGTVLSPKEGLVVSEGSKGWVSRYHFIYPTCGAWGLGYVGGNVMSLGNHMLIHKKVGPKRVRYISEPDLYLRSDVRKGNVTRRIRRCGGKPEPFNLEAYFRTGHSKK